MAYLEVELSTDRVDAVEAELVDAGAAAVQRAAGSATLRVWASDPAQLESLRALLEARAAGAVQLRDDAPDWQRGWLDSLGPVALGERLVWLPVHRPLPEDDRRVLRFEPEVAFGDGEHPTTRLAARAVEARCAETAPSLVIDVGTGNGVLALVALASGAERALCFEVDPLARRAARRNARLNDMHERCIVSNHDVSDGTERASLVVANIELSHLLALAPSLARRTLPGARLLLTGVLREQVAELSAAFRGFGEVQRSDDGDWALLELEAPADVGAQVAEG